MIEGLASRLKEARLQTGVRLGRTVSQDLMAQLVTDELQRMGSDKTVSQPMWSQYEGGVEPALAVVRAVARVSGLREPWIVYAVPPRDEAPEQRAAPPVMPASAFVSKSAEQLRQELAAREGAKKARRRPGRR